MGKIANLRSRYRTISAPKRAALWITVSSFFVRGLSFITVLVDNLPPLETDFRSEAIWNLYYAGFKASVGNRIEPTGALNRFALISCSGFERIEATHV